MTDHERMPAHERVWLFVLTVALIVRIVMGPTARRSRDRA